VAEGIDAVVRDDVETVTALHHVSHGRVIDHYDTNPKISAGSARPAVGLSPPHAHTDCPSGLASAAIFIAFSKRRSSQSVGHVVSKTMDKVSG
jgi:hypothetical protein